MSPIRVVPVDLQENPALLDQAFGTASIAVPGVAERMARGHPVGSATDLFVEFEVAHSRLRILFDQEHDDDVLVPVPHIVELAERMACVLEQEEHRPGI